MPIGFEVVQSILAIYPMTPPLPTHDLHCPAASCFLLHNGIR